MKIYVTSTYQPAKEPVRSEQHPGRPRRDDPRHGTNAATVLTLWLLAALLAVAFALLF